MLKKLEKKFSFLKKENNNNNNTIFFNFGKKYNIPELIELNDKDLDEEFITNIMLKYNAQKKEFMQKHFKKLKYFAKIEELEEFGFNINYFITLNSKEKEYLTKKNSIILIDNENRKWLGIFYPRVDIDIDFDNMFIFGGNVYNYFFGKRKDLSFLTSDKEFKMEVLLQYMESNDINDIGIDPINEAQYIITAEISKKNVLLTQRPIIKSMIDNLFNSLMTETGIDTTTEFPTTTGLLKIGLVNKEGIHTNRTFRINFIKVKTGYTASIRRFMNYEEIRDLGLKGLSYKDKAIELIDEAIKQKSGVSMVLGETNSGKSTLLAAILNKIFLSQQKIISIENPIEIKMPYLQIDLSDTETADEKFKMTKELAEKAILRHNPNVVLMSEIRSKDEIGYFADLGLRGHMALATLHAGSVANTIEILLKVADETQLKSIMNLFVHQELLAKKCQKCKGEGKLNNKICSQCGGNKSHGVIPIYEIVKFSKLGKDDSLRDFDKLIKDNKIKILRKQDLAKEYYDQGLIFEEDYERIKKVNS